MLYGVDVALMYTNTFYVEADTPEQASEYAKNIAMDNLSIYEEDPTDSDSFDSADVLAVWEEE